MEDFFFILHVILFVVGVMLPFVGSRSNLELYSIVIPFLFFHWAMNDDTCALTQLEVMVSGKPKDRTFIGRFIGPIYNMPDDKLGKIVKTIFFTLWLIVQWRLGRLF